MLSAFAPIRDSLAEAIRTGDDVEAAALAQQAVDAGVSPEEIFDSCVVPVLKDIGEQFGRLEIFLPEMIVAADAAKAVFGVLEPVLEAQQAGSMALGRIVIGTAAGDVHDIGKNMVAVMLEVNGFEVIDLGTDVSPRDFLKTARSEEADIIAISSLLTTSLPYMKDVLAVLDATGRNEQFSVMLGGGPVTADWAHEVGADGYGKDAAEAVDAARGIVGAG
ncbi:MAG: B12-binding domain-containing protein [Acidimicrobiia bacterium]